jgi:hypothetical protein
MPSAGKHCQINIRNRCTARALSAGVVYSKNEEDHMNRRGILSISAVTVLGLAFVPSSAVSQQKSLKEQLVGAWTLVSQEFTTPDGTKRQGFAGVVVGPNARGILILDAGGRYAFVAGTADRPKFKTSGAPRLEGTAEEYKAAVQSFAANYGSWSVNEADKTLTQRFESALIPNAEGTDDKASVSLAGDELKLSASFAGGHREEVYRRGK